MALRNMLDGDGQDQFDAGGWCFPKPIPPVQRNGEWVVRRLMGLDRRAPIRPVHDRRRRARTVLVPDVYVGAAARGACARGGARSRYAAARSRR